MTPTISSVCQSKRTYSNIKDATDAITSAFWYHDSIQRWYKCPECNQYHLTTATHE